MINLEEELEAYKAGESLTSIANRMGIDRHCLSDRLKKSGIIIVNRQNTISFNEHIFDVIDTEQKAYWLGFIYADGSISDQGRLELSLAVRDLSHLQQFANFLNCSNKILVAGHRCRVLVSSQHLKRQLAMLGVFPRKSLTLKFPSKDQVPEHLIFPFLRGYFDGDGSLGIYSKSPRLSCLGTLEFLTEMQSVLGFNKKFKKDSRHRQNTYSIELYCKNAIVAAKILYKDSTIHLQRKYEKYLNLIAVQDEKSPGLLLDKNGEGCDS